MNSKALSRIVRAGLLLGVVCALEFGWVVVYFIIDSMLKGVIAPENHRNLAAMILMGISLVCALISSLSAKEKSRNDGLWDNPAAVCSSVSLVSVFQCVMVAIIA